MTKTQTECRHVFRDTTKCVYCRASFDEIKAADEAALAAVEVPPDAPPEGAENDL